MANWRKWGIGQESIKGFAKPKMRWQREKSWQMAIIRKWQILGEKGKFRRKCMASMPKSHQGFCQIFKQGDKKRASWQMAILRKFQIWQESIGLAEIKTRWQKRHVDNCGFYDNDKFCEINEFGFIQYLPLIVGDFKKLANWENGEFTWHNSEVFVCN